MKKTLLAIISLGILLNSCSLFQSEKDNITLPKSIGGQSSGLTSNSGSNAE